MAVVISGTNNSDKITATDGLIDLLSSVNFASEVSVPSFKVGSDIQFGNAGIITATTLVGNVQGNINHTSNLLLQISGSEKFRVGTSGQLGIGGANYGTSGQVLTSGGSSSAASWTTITGTTINNNADNRIITGSGTANTLNGESNLTFDGSTLGLTGNQTVSGNLTLNDNANLYFGTSGAELKIRSDGSDVYVEGQGSGNIFVKAAGNENVAGFYVGASKFVRLYHNSSTKLETTSSGISVTGTVAATSYTGDGSNLTGIDTDLVSDTSPQLGGHLDVNNFQIKNGNQIYEIVSNARHKFSSGGNQIIDINGNGVDFLYGNNTHADSVESRFGTGNDLRISHDGTTNHIKGTGSHATMFWTSNVERWYIDSNGHFKPGANGNYDIGASNARVRNAYISDLKLSNEGQSNDVDGTWGDWTLQEGKDKVYMINNRTGKKYSLKMEEE